MFTICGSDKRDNALIVKIGNIVKVLLPLESPFNIVEHIK